MSVEADTAGLTAFEIERARRKAEADARRARLASARRSAPSMARQLSMRDKEVQELRGQVARLRQETLVLGHDNDELRACIARGAVPGWDIALHGEPVRVPQRYRPGA